MKHRCEAPEERHGLERAAGSPHQIANAHTLFNLLLAFVALPFLPWGAALARWTVAAPPDAGAGTPHVQHPDERALEMPSPAFAQATRESLRRAEMVQRMLAKVMTVFEANERDLVDDISEGDDYVDYLEHHWPRKKSARGWSFQTRGRAG